jgi:hypothetical protein
VRKQTQVTLDRAQREAIRTELALAQVAVETSSSGSPTATASTPTSNTRGLGG